MAIDQLYIPYPDFKLFEVIDPEEHDANNADITNKINQMVTILNSFIGGEANDSLSAMAVATPAIDPFPASNVEQLFRDLIGALRSVESENSGADFVKATPIEGLSGETVQALLNSLKQTFDQLVLDNEDAGAALATHRTSGDHDDRYPKREDVNEALKTLTDTVNDSLTTMAGEVEGALEGKTDVLGDHMGTWMGMTLLQVLSKSGTGFGTIEVLDADPLEPDVGRIWIVTSEESTGGGE